MLACKHIGCAPEDLLEREPGPEVHSLPDDIVRLRLQHEERRRRQLVARVRSKYDELKLAEEERAVQARPASAPSSARPSVFERQMTRLQRMREAKMAQWLVETERRAQLELKQNLEADAARARLVQLKAVREQVRRAQANKKFVDEQEQRREQQQQEAERCELQLREYEGEQRKRRAEAEARRAAQRAAREAQEAAKRATQARRAETRRLRQQQEEEDGHKLAAAARRRKEHAQRALAEQERHHAQKTARYAAAAARVEAAKDRLGRESEQARQQWEKRQHAMDEKKRARDAQLAKQRQQQQERWEQQQLLRSANSSRAEEMQRERLGKLLDKMVRQEHVMQEVRRQQALQAETKRERRNLQLERTLENAEMLANARAFGTRCLESKHREQQRKYDAARAARRRSVERAMAETEAMRLDREGIKLAFHQVASQGRPDVKPDAQQLGSLTGSKGVDRGSPTPPLPTTPPPAGRAPRPHTAAARLGDPSEAEHGGSPARPTSPQPGPATSTGHRMQLGVEATP